MNSPNRHRRWQDATDRANREGQLGPPSFALGSRKYGLYRHKLGGKASTAAMPHPDLRFGHPTAFSAFSDNRIECSTVTEPDEVSSRLGSDQPPSNWLETPSFPRLWGPGRELTRVTLAWKKEKKKAERFENSDLVLFKAESLYPFCRHKIHLHSDTTP